MAELTKYGSIREFIEGEKVNSSIEWADVEVLASFDNATGLNLSIERLTFVRDAYNKIKQYIDDGNIFEGLEYTWEAFNESNSTKFDFWLDLTDNLIEFPIRGAYETKAVLQDGNQQLNDRLSAVTFGYLEDIGEITSVDYVDVEYSVQKKFEPLEIATTIVIIYIMGTAIAERIKDLGNNNATSSGINASSPTGSLGAAIFAVLAFLLEVAYAAAVALSLFELVRNVLGYFIQPRRTHKAIKLKTLLEKASAHLGYGFETDIADLDFITYLPSNNNTDSIDGKGFINIPGTIKKGIPNAQDFGYTAQEAFDIAQFYFNGIYQVVDGVIQFRSENSDYWVRESTLILPSIKDESVGYNTNELFANYLIAFLTDITDDYTIDNFKGTNFEVITDIKTPVNPDAKFIKGLNEVRIPLALGSRKESLSALEEILKTMASIADEAINVFGGNSNLVNAVKSRLGTLKVSNNNHQVPKLLWLEDGKIPFNHRDKLSARVSWEKYHSYKSFVENNGIGQKLVYTDKEIPFGYEDFLEVSKNSYFTDQQGRTGQYVSLKALIGQQKAIASYWIREKYTDNLKERFIEPE